MAFGQGAAGGGQGLPWLAAPSAEARMNTLLAGRFHQNVASARYGPRWPDRHPATAVRAVRWLATHGNNSSWHLSPTAQDL